tara:strand:+ start:5604 stop:6590 length:987 start_codon:yes stop_codon:yes gene_type:complete
MSTPIAQYKLPSRIEIGFDSEAKASIADLKVKLDEANKNLNARDSGLWSESKKKSNSRIGQIIATAISNQIKETLRPDGLLKEMSPPDGLLKAMQAEAANDSPQLKLKHMGQWVFEGQNDEFQSAAVDGDGRGFLYLDKKSEIKLGELKKHFVAHGLRYVQIDGVFDTSDWENSAIDRETVNDVEYLSESVPEIQGMDAREIIIDECDWLSESVPQITQADMQLIFIKNLSDVLIQRMHSMDRFSEDDYAIGGKSLESWDIVFCELIDAYAILTRHKNGHHADLLILGDTGLAADAGWCTDRAAFKTLRTITEAELSAFRTALEACYA